MLKLPGLGISLEYGPGTVVGIAGKVLEHEVPSFDGVMEIEYAMHTL